MVLQWPSSSTLFTPFSTSILQHAGSLSSDEFAPAGHGTWHLTSSGSCLHAAERWCCKVCCKVWRAGNVLQVGI